MIMEVDDIQAYSKHTLFASIVFNLSGCLFDPSFGEVDEITVSYLSLRPLGLATYRWPTIRWVRLR